MARIKKTRPADADHVVHEIASEDGSYMRQPCEQCPWRLDSPIGAFPAEAFRISALTAYDAAREMFACHMAGIDRSKTCAGFLLANSANNLGVRLARAFGSLDMSNVCSPHALYRSYREMAEANGVAPDDPVLARCRADDE